MLHPAPQLRVHHLLYFFKETSHSPFGKNHSIEGPTLILKILCFNAVLYALSEAIQETSHFEVFHAIPGTPLRYPLGDHPYMQMATLNEVCWQTVEEDLNFRDDFAGSANEAKERGNSLAAPSRTSSSENSQVLQQLGLDFEVPNLELELNTFKFCVRLPFTPPPPNTSQTCCLCEREYYPEWCLRGPETSVILPCGCLIGHLCALHWFSKCELGNQNCPNCNTLVVDGFGNAIRVDKPEQWTDDWEPIELSKTESQPDAREATDLDVPANQQESRKALPWDDIVTSEEVDDVVHGKLSHSSRRQGTGIIIEENEFAWLSLADPAGNRPRDQDDDELSRGRSRQSPADVAAASDNKKLVRRESSGKAGPTKATRGLAKAVSTVNMLMRPY